VFNYFDAVTEQSDERFFMLGIGRCCRSQWPRCPKHELFSPLERWDRGFDPIRGMDVFLRLLCVCVALGT
jgi:hypothetical protein